MKALFLIPFFLFASLQDRLVLAKKGDFVVYSYSEHFTLLHLKELSEDLILLEEITIPQKEYRENSFRIWYQKGGPHHTSHTLFEIDHESHILSCYSLDDHTELAETPIFSHLFSLPMKELSLEERRKVGPLLDDFDTRPLWNPPTVFEGVLQKRPLIAYKATLPKDDTELSELPLNLYFLKEFFFPMILEIRSTHLTLLLKAEEAGRDLTQP